ncbi:hypothetical protein CXG53_21350 [Pseudomonas guariconensis]|uniref:Uncharacterized protein n=1 Tax=Pseudomonas guariconensis TaxID=1288410 RepID=A0AAX0VRU2_9PSED|nr:hypothetical protein CXG49_21030 [Pseudomonas guariconensis]PLV22171.1 hypothetical protein CXG53_21350 [Pseudomonas guariconensis]PLV30440.1 hypothetical protein CXG51_06620 [Pseudomonas guariconensis]
MCEILWLISNGDFGIFARYFLMAQLKGKVVGGVSLFAGKPAATGFCERLQYSVGLVDAGSLAKSVRLDQG